MRVICFNPPPSSSHSFVIFWNKMCKWNRKLKNATSTAPSYRRHSTFNFNFVFGYLLFYFFFRLLQIDRCFTSLNAIKPNWHRKWLPCVIWSLIQIKWLKWTLQPTNAVLFRWILFGVGAPSMLFNWQEKKKLRRFSRANSTYQINNILLYLHVYTNIDLYKRSQHRKTQTIEQKQNQNSIDNSWIEFSYKYVRM